MLNLNENKGILREKGQTANTNFISLDHLGRWVVRAKKMSEIVRSQSQGLTHNVSGYIYSIHNRYGLG